MKVSVIEVPLELFMSVHPRRQGLLACGLLVAVALFLCHRRMPPSSPSLITPSKHRLRHDELRLEAPLLAKATSLWLTPPLDDDVAERTSGSKMIEAGCGKDQEGVRIVPENGDLQRF